VEIVIHCVPKNVHLTKLFKNKKVDVFGTMYYCDIAFFESKLLTKILHVDIYVIN